MLCWGNASFGQLGLGGIDEEIVLEPRNCDFFLNKNICHVGCGSRHTVFVLDDGTVYTCGCNDLGQLGHDKGRKKPEQVGALDAQNIVAVSCGEAHTLALNDKGQVFSWGLAKDGQIGLSVMEGYVRIPRNIKSLSEVQIVQVTCGYHHSMALSRESEIFVWGANKYGQLGLGYEQKNVNAPRHLKSLSGIPFHQLAAGGAHSFALTLSGGVFGWGRNKFGQLGLNDENDRYVPCLLKSLRSQKIVHICCGEDHTAALTKEGGVFTFGAGGYGQLGHNSTNHEINPRKVFELMGSIVTQIACGRQHTMAFVPSSGRIYSCGLGGNGQLGTGTTCNRKSPFTVKGNWLSHSDYSKHLQNAEGHYCVKRIYSGGDQSFAHYFYIKLAWSAAAAYMGTDGANNCLPPDDLRICNHSRHIWTINEELIQRWLTFSSGRLPPDIVNEIDKVFSSAACVNGSFLATSNNDHYRTCAKFSGIDMNSARLLFHKLLGSAQPQTIQQVAASLEKNLIPKLTSSPPDIEALRLYLTLPECPLMTDPNNFFSLAVPFGTAIISLEKAPLKVLGLRSWWGKQVFKPPDHLNALSEAETFQENDCNGENWWSVLEHPEFMRLVQLFKNVVLHLLKLMKIGIPFAERRLSNTCLNTAFKILEILHRVNAKSAQIIPYDKFYIHEIQDFIDIQNDYVSWIQQRALGVMRLTALCRVLLRNLSSLPYIKIEDRSPGLPEQRSSLMHCSEKEYVKVQESPDAVLCERTMDVNQGLSEGPDGSLTICTYPFVFDAQAKTTLLQTDAFMQMQMAVDQAHRQNFSSMFLPVVESVDPCLILIVRRDNIVGDAMEVLRKTKNIDYKKPLKVIFVGEEAVDAGGVRKEFFLLIMRELLDPKYGMFRYYEESRLIWFSDQTFEDSDLFHLIGVVCGLAIYNFTIVDLHFPLALYKKLLKKKTALDDLKELMPDVGRSMQQLLDYTEDDVEETFCLNFTITVDNFGTTEVRELIPNGAETTVNKKNRQEFVDAFVNYVFNHCVASLFDAFYKGFHKVCGGRVLELFQPNELQAMVIGNTNYDWKELQKHTEYKGEYWAHHPTIKMFWEVFHELSLENKKQFLLFLTGSDRIPILGMKSLKLIIQPTGGGEEFLPVAHTCFNLLDLPKYNSKENLRAKLIQAIDHYEGFSLV